MTTNVRGFKLTSGSEVIGKLIEEKETGYVLEDAFFLQTVPKQDGTIDVQYVPLTILAKPTGKNHMGFDFELPRSLVVWNYEPVDGIVAQYSNYTSVLDLSAAPSVR